MPSKPERYRRILFIEVLEMRGLISNYREVDTKVLNTPPPLEGAQWLSGRVLDSRPKGSGFEPHRRHCVVVLEQDTFILA